MPEQRIAIISREGCIGCERCLAVCPADAITMVDGIAVVDAYACTGCEQCVPACPSEAIKMSGDAPATAAEPRAAEPAAQAAPKEAASGKVPEVWVFVEHSDNRPANVSWELLGKGKELAQALEGRVCSVLLGKDTGALVKEAFAYGADRVYVMDDPVLGHYLTETYLHGVKKLIEKYQPDIMIFGATTMGRDLAGAVATKLRTGLTADCTGLTIDPQSKLLEQTRPAYGGNIMATILCEKRRPQMATVRPRVMPMPPRDDSHTGEVVKEELDLKQDQVAARIVEYVREEQTEVTRIEDANILISGGRGLGGPEGFKMLEELADAIGGCVSGSRAAVDQGWIGHDRQVGQTGKTVRPRLYIACGISGAIQHLVGMQTADVIIAINRDPNAAIFGVATYGIVGDVREVVPALTRACIERLTCAVREQTAAGAPVTPAADSPGRAGEGE